MVQKNKQQDKPQQLRLALVGAYVKGVQVEYKPGCFSHLLVSKN